MEVLRPSESGTAKQQKTALTDVVWGKYLAVNAPDRTKATFPQLMYIVWVFREHLSDQRVEDLSPRLVGWLKDPQVVASVKVPVVRVAESLPEQFGLAGQYPDIAATWVSASNQWQALSDEDLVTLAVAIGSGTSPLCQQQRAKLPTLFLEKYFGENPTQLSLAKGVYFSWRMFPLLSLEEKRQVADKLAPRAGEAQTVRLLTELAILLDRAERVDKDKGYAQFATALAGLLEASGPVRYPLSLALPLGTAETRATLAEEMIGVDNSVRRGVSQVLAWAYRQYETPQMWAQFIALLDGKVADESITGDKKADWLLARADAEVSRPHMSVLRAKQWLDRALTVSASEAMKLQCVERLAIGYAKAFQEGKAGSLVASVANQFQSEESQVKLAALGQRVDQVAAEVRAARAKAREEAEERAKQAHIDELKRRLAVAQQAGDQTAIQRYERLLAQQE